jgi:uncharacterized protein (TIGR02186 family)
MLFLMGLLAATAAAVSTPAPQLGDGQLTVEPARVEVTMLYTGRTVRVTTSAPAGARVAISVAGNVRSLELKRKGKFLGLIWMNVGDVTFPALPELYLLRTTGPLMDLAEPDVLSRLGIGWEALRRQARDTAALPGLFGELVALKERDGLWDIQESGVTTEPSGEGTVRATAEFFLPTKAPPGDYRVLAYAFGEGEAEAEGTLLGEGRLQVAQVGIAAFIMNLARNHGLLYGVLAVLAAGAAGLLTGVVFGLGDRKGHT